MRRPAFIFRKIILIAVLLGMIMASLYLLKKIELGRKPLIIANYLRPVIIRKENELVVETANPYFDPLRNFEIVSLTKTDVYGDNSFRLDRVDNYIYQICADNNAGSSSSDVVIKVIPLKKETVIKEQRVEVISEEKTDAEINGKSVVEGIKDVYIRKDSSISQLQQLLSDGIMTTQQLRIDYSAVNLSKSGVYPVNYYCGDQTIGADVYVYD